MSKIIDLTYVKKEQKEYLERLQSSKGMEYQDATYNVPYWFTLSLQAQLSKVLITSKVNEMFQDGTVDRVELLQELAEFMGHIGTLANMLNQHLVLTVEEIQVTAVETTFNRLIYWITTLNWNKRHARNSLKNSIMPLFLELVYSFGFSIEELEEAYKGKLEVNVLEKEHIDRIYIQK